MLKDLIPPQLYDALLASHRTRSPSIGRAGLTATLKHRGANRDYSMVITILVMQHAVVQHVLQQSVQMHHRRAAGVARSISLSN
jgi:hypothetical protein